MLKIDLITQKNLLAFSAGVDSSALFFLLLSNNIPFDIAIVDYNQRPQSKDEVLYAQYLASKYNKKCFLTQYKNTKFSEKDARDFRYKFFDDIIEQYSYDTLITAHQLNDKFEWFLMQLSKGAGVVELVGLKKYSYRKNYMIFKPLLDISKEQLLEYLKINKIKYFLDSSNKDTKYKRNYFRQQFSDLFISNYKDGLIKSFEYIDKDINSLENMYKTFKYKDLYIGLFKTYDENIMIRFIDQTIKKMGVIVSSSTRDEIFRQKSIIISSKIAISIVGCSVWITYYIKIPMDKQYKELARINKIPNNIRGYLYNNNINNFLEKFKEI